MEQSSAKDKPPSVRRHPLHRYSWFWFIPAVCVFVVTSIWTALQTPRDSSVPFRIEEINDWLQPIDSSYVARLDQIQADLYAVYPAPNGKDVWVGGKGGMIAHSADGGRHWKKEEIVVYHLSGTGLAARVRPSSGVGQVPAPLDADAKTLAAASKCARYAFPGPPSSLIDFGALSETDLASRASAIEKCMSGAGYPVPSLIGTFAVQHSQGRVISIYDLASVIARLARSQSGASNHWSFELIPSALAGENATPNPPTVPLVAGAVDAIFYDHGALRAFVQNRGIASRSETGVWSLVEQTWSGSRPASPNTWLPPSPLITNSIHAAEFLPDKRTGYAVGDRGVVLKSVDGGRHWTHCTREWMAGAPEPLPASLPWPPLWYVIVNGVVTLPLLGMALRARPRDDAGSEEESVAGILTSDKPLDAGDPDPINMRSIALAISRFLRNENTVPPLTIAVTGEWGSGKSSLMNLLKADLTDFGFRPVWFNPWHHQKEEHLLASLLQSIRLQATPRWWRPENFAFRARLIWIRGWKNRAMLLMLILFIALALGIENRHDHSALQSVGSIADSFAADPFDQFIAGLPDKLQKESVFLLTLLGVSLPFARALIAFGSTPAKLLATLSGSARIRDLDAEMSFRYKFASEFRDVTRALGPRSLLIFIDDLDRCHSDSVREVLEAVNFLVTSGDCFVVLGMDRTRVERYLAAGYAEISREEPDFARKYLDKLINIEVPVPRPTPAQSSELLASDVHPAVPRLLDRVRGGAVSAAKLWPVAVSLFIAYAGFRAGQQLVQSPQAMTPVVSTQPSNTAQALPPPATTAVAAAAIQPALVIAGTDEINFWTYWPAVLLAIPLLMVAWWLATRPRDLVLSDSPRFVKALRIWHPLIITQLRTPRSLKRFMNRLRYLAMRQRPPEEGSTFWRGVKAWALGRKPRVPEVIEQIPEPTLVALAALDECAPELMNLKVLVSRDHPAGVSDDLWKLFLNAHEQHAAAFGLGWDVAKALDAYRTISTEGVRAN